MVRVWLTSCVSTVEQNLAAQREAIEQAGASKVFAEKRSGTDDARPVLAEVLRYLREGDQLLLTRADRLARSTAHLLTVVGELRQRGVRITFLEQPSGSPQSDLMLAVLAAVAKFETDLRKGRQREGIASAQKCGVKFGRQPLVTDATVSCGADLKAKGRSVAEIMAATGLSKSSAMRAQRKSVTS